MSFKIKPVRHFKRTVSAEVPSETLDVNENVKFVALFRALKRTEIEELNKPIDIQGREDQVVELIRDAALGGGALTNDALRDLGKRIVESVLSFKDKRDDRDFLRAILLGVEDATDENGVPVSPTAARDAVIEDMTLCTAAVEVFNAQYSKAKSGN